jgi:hypothetical protein
VAEGKAVRYSHADREVVVDRPPVADDRSSRSDASGQPPVDRRHGERRRIDRLSTDL